MQRKKCFWILLVIGLLFIMIGTVLIFASHDYVNLKDNEVNNSTNIKGSDVKVFECKLTSNANDNINLSSRILITFKDNDLSSSYKQDIYTFNNLEIYKNFVISDARDNNKIKVISDDVALTRTYTFKDFLDNKGITFEYVEKLKSDGYNCEEGTLINK